VEAPGQPRVTFPLKSGPGFLDGGVDWDATPRDSAVTVRTVQRGSVVG
jgi:hypothetical protein